MTKNFQGTRKWPNFKVFTDSAHNLIGTLGSDILDGGALSIYSEVLGEAIGLLLLLVLLLSLLLLLDLAR